MLLSELQKDIKELINIKGDIEIYNNTPAEFIYSYKFDDKK